MDPAQSVNLPADPRAAGLARAHVRRVLRNWDLLALQDEVVLLACEVVTNVVVHSMTTSTLTLERQGEGVRVTVTDRSGVLPVRRRHSLEATTGRGVQLLDDLADEWGSEPVPGGKAVFFVVSGRRDPWARLDAATLLAEGEL